MKPSTKLKMPRFGQLLYSGWIYLMVSASLTGLILLIDMLFRQVFLS